MGFRSWRLIVLLGFWALTISPAAAQDFYKGKTIRVIVATTPGGGFDAYSRMLTRHMGKHIPGHPAFVVENMPGAAFLIGTNYLYTHAKPDGLTLGNWIGTLVLHQLTEGKESSSTRASSNTSARSLTSIRFRRARRRIECRFSARTFRRR